MTHRVDEILSQVVEETLSQLAFVFPEDMGSDTPGDAPLDVTASVTFRGPFGGTLILETEASVLSEMTANMLGSAPGEASKDEQDDALKEILNVICGNLLPKIGGDTAVFDIGAPKIDSALPPLGVEAGVTRMVLDDGVCRTRLYIDGQLPEPA